jgi:hypothetical protein
MIPIKLQCGCGQKYAFEVEPVGGGVPFPVACPACGADGTAAANVIIAQSPVTPPAATTAHLHVAAATTPPRRPTTPLPGQVDRTQAEYEARARISWGDPPSAVMSYLSMQGFTREEALGLVQALFEERVAILRRSGITKIAIGSLCLSVPIIYFLISLSLGVIYVYRFLITVAIGFYGLWLLIKGIFIVISPKSQTGDVAEQ